MLVVPKKRLLSWYLVTLKLRERIHDGQGLPILSPKLGSFVQPQQQQFAPLGVLVNRNAEKHEIESHIPEDYWTITIKGKLGAACEDNAADLWGKVGIYKIPHYLIDPSDRKAYYIPQTVSLGPYHHGKTQLQQMERHKWRALRRVLERTGRDIGVYLDSMMEIEDRTRACYEEPLELTSRQFVEMMLLDGCFILEILQGAAEAEGFEILGYAKNDPIFSLEGPINFIQQDMIMLENQIPLFVLDKLLGLQLKNMDGKMPINKDRQKGLTLAAQLAIELFGSTMLTDGNILNGLAAKLSIALFDPSILTNDRDRRSKIRELYRPFDPYRECGLHFLDVFRKSVSFKGPSDSWNKPPMPFDGRTKHQRLFPRITELKDSGIKFRKRKSGRLWSMEFKDGVFFIPRILIHDGTKSWIFNLIAFEQCFLGCKKDIAQYIVFLDNLIDSAEDVRYLRRHGIIEHWLGSDAEVSDLVNSLGQVVVSNIKDSYLHPLSEEINRYYDEHRRRWKTRWKQRWNTSRATLRERYFNSPWAIISFLAAVFLLIMTAAQILYGVYSYYWPTN